MSAINEFPSELLSKYFAGEANAEEAIEVDEWRNTPENEAQFKQMNNLWNRLPGATPALAPVVADAWNELVPQLIPAKPSLLHRFLLNRYAVAAILAGAVVLLSILWLNNNNAVSSSNDTVLVVMNHSAAIKKEKLPDGSAIVLRPQSSVEFASDFNSNNRRLQLKGEAFFDVAHNAAKPFVISINQLHVQVIGTAFNVRQWLDSSHVEVQVQSGVVKMYTTQQVQIVHKGQTGIYDARSGLISLKDTLNINSFSYATRHFSFNDLSLKEVCDYIEIAYDVQITLNESTGDCRLSGEFNEIKLHDLIDLISTALNLHFDIDGDTVHLTGEGCH